VIRDSGFAESISEAVIPAKAGTQARSARGTSSPVNHFRVIPAKAGTRPSGLQMRGTDDVTAWIPASTGMTTIVNVPA